MDVERLITDVVKNTNGWVIVVVFVFYFLWRGYETHKEKEASIKTLGILDDTVKETLSSANDGMRLLTQKIEQLMDFCRSRRSI